MVLVGASGAQIRQAFRHKTDQMLDTYTVDVDVASTRTWAVMYDHWPCHGRMSSHQRFT